MNINYNFKKMIMSGIEITSALDATDKILKKELPEQTTEQERMEYFYGKTKQLRKTKHYMELKELWGLMEPYVWNCHKGSLDKYWTIQVMREINTAWQVYWLNNVIDRQGEEELNNLNKLLQKIEEIPDKLYIIINVLKEQGIKVRVIYSLKYFDEQYYHPYRDYIIRNILKTSGKQPFYVVDAGASEKHSVNVTGYYVQQNLKWDERKHLHNSINNMTDAQVLTARREGIMMGYVLDDL